MERHPIKKQLRDNMVALISLVVAVSALLYTAWREETTEKNRTLRTAGFEVLENLGELQIITNHAAFAHDKEKGNPYEGWGRVLLISDLSEILPEQVQEHTNKLHAVWSENANKIGTNEEAAVAVSQEIDESRASILDSIRHLR